MGSRIQKIAGIIFALMFVAVIAVLNTGILTLGTSANKQLSTTVNSTDSALAIYDQGVVSGSSVITAAKSPDKVCSTELTIYVATAGNSSAKSYTKLAPYSASGVTAATTINNSANFDSYLCYNTNDVVTGILFVQDTAKGVSDSVVTSNGSTAQGFDASKYR